MQSNQKRNKNGMHIEIHIHTPIVVCGMLHGVVEQLVKQAALVFKHNQ